MTSAYSKPLTLSLWWFSKLVLLGGFYSDKMTAKENIMANSYNIINTIKTQCTVSRTGGSPAGSPTSTRSHFTLLAHWKAFVKYDVLPFCYLSRAPLIISLRYIPLIECLWYWEYAVIYCLPYVSTPFIFLHPLISLLLWESHIHLTDAAWQRTLSLLR